MVITVLAVMVPLRPAMPSAGLDPSWGYGLNQAVAQHLAFGKEIIFSFGPYASVFTKMYHPATDHLMILGSLFLGICYATALVLLTRQLQLVWILIFAAFLGGGFVSIPDSLFLSYPLLLATVVYSRLLAGKEPATASKPGISLPVFALLFSALGLLALVKVSFVTISGAIAALCFIALWRLNQKRLAYCCLLAPIVSAIVFWLTAGQPLFALPFYVARLLMIVSGYSEAMALSGNGKEIAAYLLAAVGILWVAGATPETSPSSRLFLFFSFGLFLFVAFKEGFVRQEGHAFHAGLCLLFGSLFLRYAVRNKQATAVFVLAVFAWAYIDQAYLASSTKAYYQSVRETYRGVTHGLKLRRSSGNQLRDMFDHSLQLLNAEARIPKLKGTVDIYPHDQAYLLASGNIWSPRPVLQSYSAYTPGLARLDANHLRGGRSADNILFKVEPIDRRFPSLADGLSWPILVNDYSPVMMDGGLLYLVKKSSQTSGAPVVPLSTETHDLGETVAIPHSSGPLFAEVDIRQTMIGHLVSLLYKPTLLQIAVELEDGTRRSYRLVSGMAKAGFVISPLVESTGDFALLFGEQGFWAQKRVKTIRVVPVTGTSLVWKSQYVLKLGKLQLGPPANVPELLHFDKVVPKYSKEANEAAIITCDGSLDVINGLYPAPASARSGSLVSVEGWLAVSAKDGVVPDAVFVTLTDEQGRATYLTTRPTPRTDVKTYFNHPEMKDVGYATYADVSTLNGKYYIGLAETYEGKLRRCQQFKVPIVIRRDE